MGEKAKEVMRGRSPLIGAREERYWPVKEATCVRMKTGRGSGHSTSEADHGRETWLWHVIFLLVNMFTTNIFTRIRVYLSSKVLL